MTRSTLPTRDVEPEVTLGAAEGTRGVPPPPRVGKSHVITLQSAGVPSVHSEDSRLVPSLYSFFFNNERKKQALCLQRTSFLHFLLQRSRGAGATSSTSNSGESTISVKWSETMNNLSNVTLCISALCAAALSQVTTSQCHLDTLASSRPSDRPHVYRSFPNGQQPESPSVRTCLESLRVDRVRAPGR